MPNRFFAWARTIFALGVGSVLQVAAYRFLKRLRYYEWRTPILPLDANDDLFGGPEAPEATSSYDGAPQNAEGVLLGKQALFGGEAFDTGSPPEWLTNPSNGASSVVFVRHWSCIPHFDPGFGDIKFVWELARFRWILLFARAYRQSGNSYYIDQANEWVKDWMQHNPVNTGANWMCGQETAIRLNQTILADALLQSGNSKSKRMEFFVRTHCERIEATTYYAAAQKNNHIVSEALGLFLGGAWLENHASSPYIAKRGAGWRKRGYKILERSVGQLVMEDGSFSQYSTVYHRLLLDTLSIAEWWRRRAGLAKFSEMFYEKARSATYWMFDFVDAVSGDAPNIGGNDGALVYALCDNCHRDFRPTVQLAGFLFCKNDFYGIGPWCEPLELLGVTGTYPRPSNLRSTHYPEGGFSVIRSHHDSSRMYCRFWNFKFRPSQSDVLHIDLWRDGVNILRDGGSYSYALSDEASRYFVGTSSHNTCQFDGRDQMPRLSRFLYGSWPKTQALSFEPEKDRERWSAAYTDYLGCRHERTISWSAGGWVIVDEVSGHRNNAVLRWRLCPDVEWSQLDNSIESSLASLSLSSESEFKRVELCTGWESRFYMSRTELPVLEIELGPGPHRVTTEIKLNPVAP